MTGYMIVGSMYDASSGNLSGFLLHVDGKPFVTEDGTIAVSTAIDYLKSDLEDYEDVEYGHYENVVYGVNDCIEVQYKITALDGNPLIVDDYLKNKICNVWLD